MTKIDPSESLKNAKIGVKINFKSKTLLFVSYFIILTIITVPVHCEFSLPPGLVFTGIQGEFGRAPEPPPIIILRGPKLHHRPKHGFVFVKPEWKHPWWPI